MGFGRGVTEAEGGRRKGRREERENFLFFSFLFFSFLILLPPVDIPIFNMRRFLIENGAESLLGTIKIAVLPIAKVFTMCFLGFLMASKYVNILPASGRKLLNAVSFLIPQILQFPFFFLFFSCSNFHH